MNEDLTVENCRLLEEPDGSRCSIIIENGLIKEITEFTGHPSGTSLDAAGGIALPGFIDVHIQGAGGSDVLDGTLRAIRTISKMCLRFGTTGFLATTVYRPGGDNGHLELMSSIDGDSLGGARMLGVHLEGPFLSPGKRGMIRPECICPPDRDVLEEVLSICGSGLRMMTIAPELDGSHDLIRCLHKNDVIASFGHSSASYEETLEGIASGLGQVTHIFNAMTGIHHRSPGPVLAILEAGNLPVQVITDGVHIHPRMLRWIYSQFGIDRILTITDGMCAMGLPDGSYVYNDLEYEARDGAARYSDGTLIGTTLGMNQMIGRLMGTTGCELGAAVQTASLNPARSLDLEGRMGLIAEGADADIVIVNSDLSVQATIVGGSLVYRGRD